MSLYTNIVILAGKRVSRPWITAIKLRMDSPFSLREKVRMRGSNKAFCLIFILLTPTLSSRRGSFFLNLMAVRSWMVSSKPLCSLDSGNPCRNNGFVYKGMGLAVPF
jgi:hypothetical protein